MKFLTRTKSALFASFRLVFLAGPGGAQTVDPDMWTANGPVYTIARGGGTIYIGGKFSHVGPYTGGESYTLDNAGPSCAVVGFSDDTETADAITFDTTLVFTGKAEHDGSDPSHDFGRPCRQVLR